MSIANVNIALVVALSAATMPPKELTARWPGGTWNVEDEFSTATGAFVGTLELSNIEVPDEGTVVASGRIVPRTALWGSLPSEPIELGRAKLFRLRVIAGSYVKGHGTRQGAWDKFACELSDVDTSTGFVLILYRLKNAKPELLHVMLPEKVGDSLPVEECLTIRDLETTGAGSDLRDKLIIHATSPKSSRLLWSYALRKLARIDSDPGRKFENVFSQKLQDTLEPTRTGYAAHLLTFEAIGARSRRSHAEDGRKLMRQFVHVFSSTPHPRVACETLYSLARLEGVFSSHSTQMELQFIRDRLSSACQDETHPIHKMDQHQRFTLKATMETFGVECKPGN